MGRELDIMVESLLADDVIVGVSRAARGADLRPHQQRALRRAATIFGYLSGDPQAPLQVQDDSQLRELVDVGAHAEEVARSLDRSRETQEFFGELKDTIGDVLDGNARDRGESLRTLVTFFRALSQGTQARASNEMAAAGRPAWMLSRPTGVF